MTRDEAIATIKENIEDVDTGRCPSCGWHGCRDYWRCKDCSATDNSAWSIEHGPDCIITKIIQEFGEDILDYAL